MIRVRNYLNNVLETDLSQDRLFSAGRLRDMRYLFGQAFLVCPVLDAAGIRDVYLPEGRWVDFWTGEIHAGPKHLHQVTSPLSRIPLYVRYGSTLPFAEPVAHTGLLDQARKITIRFDEGYGGLEKSELGEWIKL